MEMTFPHPVVRQKEADDSQGHRAMLAAAIARQANSQTARAVLLAARACKNSDSADDATQRRIHYFGSHIDGTIAPSGPFLATRRTQDTGQSNYENGVYQDASMNSKAHDLSIGGTGDQFNQAGHGASRTI